MGLLPTRDAPPDFQALADATPALIWVDATDHGRTLVNRAWREFTSVRPLSAASSQISAGVASASAWNSGGASRVGSSPIPRPLSAPVQGGSV